MTNRRQQATSDSESEPPSANLQRFVDSLVRVVDMGMAEVLAPSGLTSLDYSLLMYCREHREATATQMAQVLPVDPARISRIVTKVVDMGLVRRRRLRSDRRVVMLSLTDRGNELTTQLAQDVGVYNDRLTRGIRPRDMRAFEAVTQRIIANYAAMTNSA